jgi:hypothetical protein
MDFPFRLKCSPKLFILCDAAETDAEKHPAASESLANVSRLALIVCKFHPTQKYPILLSACNRPLARPKSEQNKLRPTPRGPLKKSTKKRKSAVLTSSEIKLTTTKGSRNNTRNWRRTQKLGRKSNAADF